MTLESLQKGDFILFDKPVGWTSFDVVNKVRYAIRTKCGHAGTLDPLASGLLILCTGSFTKKISDFQHLEKEYVATITLGATTPSYDLETKIDQHFSVDHIDEDLIRKTISGFTGEQKQIPPIFSAKYADDGRRAYKKARNGELFDLQSHEVIVHDLEILEIALPHIQFRIVCSKGYYVRSFAYDFGKAMNSGAYLESLRRTRIGNFSVTDAWKIDDFIFSVNAEKAIIHAGSQAAQ
jgi:tRNA pseudouridine55 synthase